MVDVEHDDTLPSTLYHYTTFNVLQSIYENGEFWTTNSRYLNDITETELGPKAIIETLREREQSANDEITKYLDSIPEAPLNQEDKDHLRSISERRNLWTELRDVCGQALRDTSCFIFSLSQEADQLSQWRAYAKDGVCIGFSTTELLESIRQAPVQSVDMRHVQYFDGRKRVVEFLDPIIDRTLQRRDELIRDGCDALSVRNSLLGQEMLLKIAFLKDINFIEEGEVRIAALGVPNHFTPNRYGLVPRIKIPITAHAIQSVIVGPGAHSELRCQSLDAYFLHQPFNKDPLFGPAEIDLYESAVPYRDW
ncbi:DUF2971 domain-containing protein [Mycobacterium sp. pW049]|uniref:DUF2971 domain-containing protein n=1 Tax=[Mycobacterium] bulgaricum TaxID=3238985 RepID=UPI00351BE5AE